MAELYNLTITESRDLLAKREVSSRELTRAVLDRIAEVDDRVRAYVTVTEDLVFGKRHGVSVSRGAKRGKRRQSLTRHNRAISREMVNNCQPVAVLG